MNVDDVLTSLDPQQREVAARPLGPMCVLAGAGTGKTRAITHRIAYGVKAGAYPPQSVLAVTFTARAAGEMRTRLRELGVHGVQARTFHAAALRQLHYFWPRAVGGGAPQVLPHKASAVAEAAARLRLRLDRAAIRDLAAEIEWAKVGMLTPETYPGAARAARREPPGLDAVAMSRLLQEYEDVKTDRGVIDFEDVLLLLVGVLAEHGEVARAVRAQYRHFVVDEYQDVNAVQQRLLDLWLGDRHDVCVVGDPAQTIYSFTGASARYLLGFSRQHAGTAVVRLVRNYRSTPEILRVANAVMRGGPGGAHHDLQAHSCSGPAPVLHAYDDDEAEAAATAEGVERLLADGTPAAHIAVLFRTNAQSEALESALAERGVPCLVRGGERYWSRPEVRRAVVLLRGAARSDRGGGDLPGVVRDVLGGTGWTATPPAARGATREAWDSLAALVELATQVGAARPGAGLRDLLAEIDERAVAQHAPAGAAVTLATLHAAKGLEWHAVFLVGCSDGLLPFVMAEGDEEVEEERRLLYVGLTRARQRLTLSWAAARNPGGRASRRPSRFLGPAAPVLGDGARSPRAPGGGRRSRPPGRSGRPPRCRTCGAELATAALRKVGRCDGCPPTYDEAVFERLRAWRLAVSQEASVPAYVVFTDATLTAIAERGPGTREELASISGVGAAKLERYGDAVLAVLTGEYGDVHG